MSKFNVEIRNAKSELHEKFSHDNFHTAINRAQQTAFKLPRTLVSYCQPSIIINEETAHGETLVYYELCIDENI